MVEVAQYHTNLSFRLQTELALHHSSYLIDKLISIHTSNFLSLLPLSLSLRTLYLSLLTLSQRLLQLLSIITIRILIPRMWHELICAGIRNQVISLQIVDLSIMSCISLQSTIEVIRINILNDPLHRWSNFMDRLRRLIGSIESSLSRPLHNLLSGWRAWLLDRINLILSSRLLNYLRDGGTWRLLFWWLPPCHLSLPPAVGRT